MFKYAINSLHLLQGVSIYSFLKLILNESRHLLKKKTFRILAGSSEAEMSNRAIGVVYSRINGSPANVQRSLQL